jgi:DNA-directed RNA polymerase specialized sigma24 family protein
METSSLRPLAPAAARSNLAPDPVLLPFLEAEDPEAAREALGALLESHATPLLRAVTRRQLGGAAPVQEGQDLEDVVAGALLRLAEQLWSLYGERSAPIESFAGYVVTTAQNACHAFLRRRQPERARLRSRLRYLLTHDPELALWEGAADPLCGLVAWRGRAASPEAAQRLGEMHGRVAADAGDGRPRSRALAFARMVRELLARAGGPCRVGELLTILEDVLGVASGPPASSEGLSNESGEITVASLERSAVDVAEQRDYLERLWAQIRLLPRHQRVALLLNLRDAAGRGMIGLLPLIGLATQAEIAMVLEMAPPRLEAVWDELPLEDEWIARELGVTRRQVINFRKCARERLWRRMSQADRT